MGKSVYVNGRGIACKSGSATVTAATPDPCLSPPSPPAGPLPVPYPVTSFSSDTTDGSKTVKVGDKEVMLKDKSYYKKCTGDEAATKSLGQGTITHTIQGKTYFIAWSDDVEIEGENAVRHLDMTTSNHASPMANASTPAPNGEDKATAENCAKASAEADAVSDEMTDKMKAKPHTLVGGRFVPNGGGPAINLPGASSVSANMGLQGQKWGEMAIGLVKSDLSRIGSLFGSFVGLARGSTGPLHTYISALGSFRHGQGHAESKIIETLFKRFWPKPPPPGKLYLKINKSTPPPGPCKEHCKKLIENAKANGMEVIECP